MVISFNPMDAAPNSSPCTPVPMPTMNGLAVGNPIGSLTAVQSAICSTKGVPVPSSMPSASPAELTATPRPTPTQTPAPGAARTVPGKLERPPLDWRINGPFPQTLFLGCSVMDFNVSLGWGNSEGSTLTVTLVRDTLPTFAVSAQDIADRSSRYAGMDYAKLKQDAINVKDTPNHYYDSMKPPAASVEGLRAALAALPANYTEDQYRAVLDQFPWSGPDEFKDINGSPIIPGKLYYEYNTTTKEYEQKYWLGPDPGFMADKDSDAHIFKKQGDTKGRGVNIIGAPVRFVIDEFIFCGIVTDWRKTISQGGTQYTVTIQTPTYLLDGSSLILGKYAGSVFTKNTNLPVIAPPPKPEYNAASGDPEALTAWETVYRTANPEAFQTFTRIYKTYISGPVNITDNYINSQLAYNQFFNSSWQGNIKNDGNITNVFNIYGFLESLAPGFFGGSRTTDQGIKYNMVIEALNVLLSEHNPGPFNPFGAIVGKSAEPLFKNPDGTANNWTDVYSVEVADDPRAQDSITAPSANTSNPSDSKSLAVRSQPPVWVTTNYGTPRSIFDFGLIPPTLSTTSGTYKQLYYLDLTELSTMPSLLRYETDGSPIISLSSFIEDVCRKAGCEFFWEMLNLTLTNPTPPPGATSNTYNKNILKLRTVIRKVQPKEDAVEEYLKGFVGAKTYLEYGESLNDSATTRVMYLGGKQKRLIQVKNYRLGKSQSAHIYSPITRKFVIIDHKEKNKIRVPHAGSTRHPLDLIRGADNTNLNEAYTGFFIDDTNWRKTFFGGGAQQNFQEEVDDENPVVQVNTTLNTARVRAGITYVEESPYTFTGNYFSSATLVNTNYKNIIVYKKRAQDNEDLNSEAKKTYKYVLSKKIDNNYIKVASWTGGGPCASRLISKSWFKIKTSSYAWKRVAAVPDAPNRVPPDANPGPEPRIQNNKRKEQIRQKITTLNRFFPLMHDVICPYFGHYNFIPLDGYGKIYDNIGLIKTPRPVWYDMWTNQLLVIFSIGDLPRTRLQLQGTYGTSFVVTESELRAALTGYDEWIKYLSIKLFKPDIVLMLQKALCPLSTIAMVDTADPGNQAAENENNPDPRNNPQAADQAGEVADGGAAAGVPATDVVLGVDNINECDFCKIFMAIFHMPKINLANGTVLHGTPPINKRGGLAGVVYDDVMILYNFFKGIAAEYYGKKFMVKLPMVRTYTDKNVYIIDDYYTNAMEYITSSPMRVMEGTGKIYSSYKISAAGAWEEYGNMIDDQIVLGGWYGNIFQNDKGLIEPILGFWSSMGFDYESYFLCKLWSLENGKAADPEKVKGSAFKMGDIIQPIRVCLDGALGPANLMNDGNPVDVVIDPKVVGLT